ncbi:hypothetical protein ACLB2K_015021 [Fragaria x ananassa]
MVNCARCCLHNSMRALNFFVNIFGVVVIIYTLWLLKKWQDGVTELPPVPMVLKPWFIYACLGAGIAVCFSTFFSYLVAHCITDSTLLLIKLAEYIKDTKFKNFMIFHLYMCRLIAILILVPQIKCTVLAIILWAIGTEPLTHCNYSDHVTELSVPNFCDTERVAGENQLKDEAPPNSKLPLMESPEPQDGDSVFAHIPHVHEVPIFAMMVAFSKDPSPLKLNLGIGVYRTEDGRPFQLNVVRRVERLQVDDMSTSKEYLPITGIAEFNRLSAKLILGADSPAIKENRVATVQCLSGSGSLRIGAEFLANHYHHHTVYMSQPTYTAHPVFFSAAGLAIKTYRYYDPGTCGLDFQGKLEDLLSAPSGAIVLLQAWLFPFFDTAYQGLVSGNLDEDAQAIRLFVTDGGECLVAQSYSKIMGLYGERVGALSIVCKTAEVASHVESQLKLLIQPMYSSPPIHGASIAATILKDWDIMRNGVLK